MHNEPKRDHSVFSEPFFDLNEQENAKRSPAIDISEGPDQIVWDEPAIRASRTPPKNAYSYSTWFLHHKENAKGYQRWLVWLAIGLLGGPLAIVSALAFGNPTHAGGYMVVVVIAPILEEIVKVALALVLLETKPYLFSNGFQIVTACMLSGFFFGSVENLLYLHVYIPDPGEFISTWRWQVCTTMHTGTTAVASLGLVRAWKFGNEHLCRPPIQLGFPMFAAAMVIHGSYNMCAIVLEYFKVFG